jgi:hypothetical protein
MSQFSKWKTIGYAAALFATGAISGVALGVYETKTHLLEPQRTQEIADRIKTRLQAKLDLSPDQEAKINPIVDNTAAEVRTARMEMAQRIGKIFEESYAKISAILTPDQRKKLDQMEKERADMMSHWQENHRRPGPPGGSPHDDDMHGGPGPHDDGTHGGPGPGLSPTST